MGSRVGSLGRSLARHQWLVTAGATRAGSDAPGRPVPHRDAPSRTGTPPPNDLSAQTNIESIPRRKPFSIGYSITI